MQSEQEESRAWQSRLEMQILTRSTSRRELLRPSTQPTTLSSATRPTMPWTSIRVRSSESITPLLQRTRTADSSTWSVRLGRPALKVVKATARKEHKVLLRATSSLKWCSQWWSDKRTRFALWIELSSRTRARTVSCPSASPSTPSSTKPSRMGRKMLRGVLRVPKTQISTRSLQRVNKFRTKR